MPSKREVERANVKKEGSGIVSIEKKGSGICRYQERGKWIMQMSRKREVEYANTTPHMRLAVIPIAASTQSSK